MKKKNTEHMMKIFVLVFTIIIIGFGIFLTYNIVKSYKPSKDDIKNSTKEIDTNILDEKVIDLYKIVHINVDSNLEGKKILNKYSFENYIYKDSNGLDDVKNINKEAYTDLLITNYDFSSYYGKRVNEEEINGIFNSINDKIFGNNLEFNMDNISCYLAVYDDGYYDFNSECGDTSAVYANYKLDKVLEDNDNIYLYEKVIYQSFGGVFSHYSDDIDNYLIDKDYDNIWDLNEYETYRYTFTKINDNYYLKRVEYIK